MRLNNIKGLPFNFWLQKGQAMVEYTVVTVFGILVLTTGPGGDVVLQLTDAVRSNYDGYSYAVSLSDYPDKENYLTLISMYNDQGMPSDQREYLTDNPNAMVDQIKDFITDSLPTQITDGLDIADSIGLGLDDFCDICDGNPFDDL